MSDLSRVNFKHLHVFVAIAEHGSFRDAAEALNRSPSAVSMQVRQLEEQLSVPLFHRTTRRVKLTREGEELLSHAQRALHEWSLGLRRIREAADLHRGALSVACVPTIAATRLPDALAAFQRAYSGIALRLRELDATALYEAVRDLQVDFAIGPSMAEHVDYGFDPICDDPIVALSSSAHPLGPEVTLERLCKMPVLLNTRAAALRAMIEAEVARRGLTLDVAFEVVQTITLIAFARAGLGVAVLPAVAVPKPLPEGTHVARITGAPMTRRIGIITARGHSLSPAAHELIAAVRRAMVDLQG